MELVLHIPDEFAEQLGAHGDVARQAYRAGRLTKAELRRLLGIGSRYELDGFLKAHDVYEPYTLEDLAREREAFQRLGY